jgi:glutamate synthase domain-containing protein 3
VESDYAAPSNAACTILVPELRDYHQINGELLHRLNLGERHIRLQGADGQRLLVAQITGAWQALIEIDGNAGTELAAELDAPGLTVVCRGSTADGAGRGMAAGRLLIGQSAGAALGYFQRGGMILANGNVGARAGLNQLGGDLVLLERVGALAGERQSGGRLFFKQGHIGLHAGRGRRGGRLVSLPLEQPLESDLAQDDRHLVETALGLANRFFSPA